MLDLDDGISADFWHQRARRPLTGGPVIGGAAEKAEAVFVIIITQEIFERWQRYFFNIQIFRAVAGEGIESFK